VSAFIKKNKRDLIYNLKLLEKQEQANPQNSRQKEIIKTRAEINEMETKQTVQSWIF
jgi:hypothetical protein